MPFVNRLLERLGELLLSCICIVVSIPEEIQMARTRRRPPKKTALANGTSRTKSTPTRRTDYALVDGIETQSGMKVSIDTECTAENLAKCSPQDMSPLFALPAELRNMIFELATAPYDDMENQYDVNSYCYRPGHHAKRVTSTALLLTCRRAWLEANDLPMRQAEHCFWFKDEERRPAWTQRDGELVGRSEEHRLAMFGRVLTLSNRANIQHVHLFAQMYWLEAHRWDVLGILTRRATDTWPKVLTITVRHTDWWWWENDALLDFKDSWLQQLLNSQIIAGVQEFRLELETLDYKLVQLKPIVERLKKLKGQWRHGGFHAVYGTTQKRDQLSRFVANNDVDETTWFGPTTIGGKAQPPYMRMVKLKYHILTITWRKDFGPEVEGFVDAASVARATNETRTPRAIMLERRAREAIKEKDREIARYAEVREAVERTVTSLAFDRPPLAGEIGANLSSEADAAAQMQRAKWAEKGSLLKFAKYETW